MEGAIVFLNKSNTTTNSKGLFGFEDVSMGNAILNVSAIGFEDKTETVTLKEGENTEREYFLAPYGKISFTSTRDGTRNIYTVNYDGSNLTNLTVALKEDCWGAQFTPDGKKIVFYSNVDKKVDQWGEW